MLRKVYLKEDGEDGYFVETSKDINNIDPDKLEWCKFCGHCGTLTDLRVCVKGNFLDILFNGVKLVASAGHCDCFKNQDNNGLIKYSKIKEKLLKNYGIERE